MQFVNIGLFDLDGNLMEIQSVGRDITGQVQAEEALKRAHDKLEMQVEETNGKTCQNQRSTAQ